MRRSTLALSLKLGVALPDGAFILAVGVPDLGTEEFPAVPAFQLCGKRPAAVMAPAHIPPALHLHLPLCRCDDGVMAAFHIILRDLALIHFPLLGKKVHRIALLEPGIAFVLFIGQYVLDGPVLPPLLPGRCGDFFPSGALQWRKVSFPA